MKEEKTLPLRKKPRIQKNTKINPQIPNMIKNPFHNSRGIRNLLIRWIPSERYLFLQIYMCIGIFAPHACNFFDLYHFLFLVPAFLDDFLPVALFSVIPFILIALVFISPRGLTIAVLALRVRGLTRVTIDFSALLVFLDLTTCEGLLIPLLDLAFILTCDILFVFEKDFLILVHLTTLFSSSSPCARSIFLALCKIAFLTTFLRSAPSMIHLLHFLEPFVIQHSFPPEYAHELLSAGPRP
jgi:hypothetical protein